MCVSCVNSNHSFRHLQTYSTHNAEADTLLYNQLDLTRSACLKLKDKHVQYVQYMVKPQLMLVNPTLQPVIIFIILLFGAYQQVAASQSDVTLRQVKQTETAYVCSSASQLTTSATASYVGTVHSEGRLVATAKGH